MFMKYIYLALCLCFLNSCTNNEKKIRNPKTLPCYYVETSNDRFFNWNHCINKIDVIPLETSDVSLIGYPTKGIIKDSCIYILDYKLQSLSIFDIKGNFLGKIGKKGQGPNEYLEIRDFVISDSLLYMLDFRKIHTYSVKSHDYKESWSIHKNSSFNPSNLVVFDKTNYYLWASNPDTWNKQEKYYRLRKISKRKVKEEYFEYQYKSSDDPRFYNSDNNSYFIKPIDGEYVVYKLNKDSIVAAFKLDFGSLSISSKEITELRDSKEKNAYLKSNFFKSIGDIYELGNYIYFKCIGPKSIIYEGLIDKLNNNVSFGKWDYKKSPIIFFGDEKYLYGYYDPSTILDSKENNSSINTSFNCIFESCRNIQVSDNIILARISLK